MPPLCRVPLKSVVRCPLNSSQRIIRFSGFDTVISLSTPHRMVCLRSSPQYIPDHFIMAFSSSLTTRALPPTQQLVVCFQFLKIESGGPTSIFVLACHSSLPPITSWHTYKRQLGARGRPVHLSL